MPPAGFPHSDTPGSTLGCQLPRAYRRLLRPSSALDAKASTTCPSQLVTHTTNPTPNQEPDRRCTQHTTKKHNTHQPINQCMPTNKHNKRPSPTNKKSRKMLASTIQISNNNPTPPPHPHTGDTGMTGTEAPAPTLPRPPQETQEAKKAARPDSSEPQQHVCRPAPTRLQEPRRCAWLASTSSKQHHPPPHHTPDGVPGTGDGQVCVLLRKEVIQPHLPVRLPCYDFVPIASPTFDGSLPSRG